MYLVGDIHGDLEAFKQRVEQANGELLIQLGDMGWGFVNVPEYPNNVYILRGNHDSPNAANNHPNYIGNFGELISGDGVNNTRFFFVSGAYSIDYRFRRPFIDCWPNEELSNEELEQAFECYKIAKPKFVVSHEAPSSVCKPLLDSLGLIQGEYAGMKRTSMHSRTSLALQRMLEYHRPEEWVFGHYHHNWTYDKDGTKFTCLGINTMKEFNAIYLPTEKE